MCVPCLACVCVKFYADLLTMHRGHRGPSASFETRTRVSWGSFHCATATGTSLRASRGISASPVRPVTMDKRRPLRQRPTCTSAAFLR